MTYRDQPVLPAFSDTSSADFSGLAHAPALTKSHSPSRFSHALFSNLILSLRAGFFWLIYLYLRGDGKADGVQFPAIKLGTVRISSTLSALIGFFLFVQFSTRTLSFLWNSWIRYSPAHLGRLMIYLEPSWENAVHRFHKFTHLPRTLAILGNSHDTSAIARSLSPVSDIVSVFELDIDDEETALCAVRELGRNGEVNTLVLAEDHNGLFDIAALINHLREMPLQVLVYSEVNPDETARKPRRSLGGLPLAIVSDAPIHFFCRVLKSSFDRICALVLILLMFPLLLMIAA